MLLEWIKIGLSGFLLSIVSFFISRKHYQRQIAQQLYTGPVLHNIYNPLIAEYKRVVGEIQNSNDYVINMNLIISTIQMNAVLLSTIPQPIKIKIELIERLCISCNSPSKYRQKAPRIIDELKNLNDVLADYYKEFKYEKKR